MNIDGGVLLSEVGSSCHSNKRNLEKENQNKSINKAPHWSMFYNHIRPLNIWLPIIGAFNQQWLLPTGWVYVKNNTHFCVHPPTITTAVTTFKFVGFGTILMILPQGGAALTLMDPLSYISLLCAPCFRMLCSYMKLHQTRSGPHTLV